MRMEQRSTYIHKELSTLCNNITDFVKKETVGKIIIEETAAYYLNYSLIGIH